jgi:hypothetical protein
LHHFAISGVPPLLDDNPITVDDAVVNHRTAFAL